jgi:WhiB family transcriptional regulator, redox-sensing transcriptional regulator
MSEGRVGVLNYAPERTNQRREGWQDDALCAQTEPELFHPLKGGSTRDAKRICNGTPKQPGCLVKAQCLAYALEHDIRDGIWGGLSTLERARIRKAAAA